MERSLPETWLRRSGGPPTKVGGEPGGFLLRKGKYPVVTSKRGKNLKIAGDFAVTQKEGRELTDG